MVTVEVEVPLALLTCREKTRVSGGEPLAIVGATKVGFAAVTLERVTAVPDIRDHWKESAKPEGSLLALPSRVTSAPDATA
jgi:hypothetical protein